MEEAQARVFPTDEMQTSAPDPGNAALFARRCLAQTLDAIVAITRLTFYAGVPILANLAYNVWEPTSGPVTATTAAINSLIEPTLFAFAAAGLLNTFLLLPAFAVSGPAQASLGYRLLGLRSCSTIGKRRSFGAALAGLGISYALFLIIFIAASLAIDAAGSFFGVLQYYEGIRWAALAFVLAAPFSLALVTDGRQNLFDLATGNRIISQKGGGARAPAKRSLSETAAHIFITTTTTAAAGATLVLLGFTTAIALGLYEVENGLKLETEATKNKEAAEHYQRALGFCPGIALLYQQYYLLNENSDEAAQRAACRRLFAVRGNAFDHLLRARLEAKAKQYPEAEEDYKHALEYSKDGRLDPHEQETARTELLMLELEHEADTIFHSGH
jgi:hypothetical protein